METALTTRATGVALRRRAILDAAREEFRAQGFHGASMAAIAGRAEMSVGQIYRYFQNKEAVVAAIVEANISDIARDMATVAAVGGDMAAGLSAHMCAAVQNCAADTCASLIFEVRAEAARNPKLGELLAYKDEQIRDQIRGLFRATPLVQLDDAEMERRVELVCILFEGMLMRLLRRPEMSQAQLARLLEEMLGVVLRP